MKSLLVNPLIFYSLFRKGTINRYVLTNRFVLLALLVLILLVGGLAHAAPGESAFDYSQLYAEKLIIDNGALELEGDMRRLLEQARTSDNIAIMGFHSINTYIVSVDLVILGLPGNAHTAEVVKSLDTHHVEIETRVDGRLIEVKICLTPDDERCITYNLSFL